MKKILALFMAAALVISAAVIPALAEEAGGNTDQVTSATSQTGKDGRGGRQMPGNSQQPRMPDRNGQQPQMPDRNGQQPQMPDQNGQQPQMPDQNGQQPQTPDRNGQQSGTDSHGVKRGNRSGSRMEKTGRFDPDQLLKAGVISQETYDAIMAYIQAQAQASQQPETGAAPAEGNEPPVPAEGSEPPAAPEETPNGANQLLKDLLDNGVITQEQYELLQANPTNG